MLIHTLNTIPRRRLNRSIWVALLISTIAGVLWFRSAFEVRFWDGPEITFSETLDRYLNGDFTPFVQVESRIKREDSTLRRAEFTRFLRRESLHFRTLFFSDFSEPYPVGLAWNPETREAVVYHAFEGGFSKQVGMTRAVHQSKIVVQGIEMALRPEIPQKATLYGFSFQSGFRRLAKASPLSLGAAVKIPPGTPITEWSFVGGYTNTIKMRDFTINFDSIRKKWILHESIVSFPRGIRLD